MVEAVTARFHAEAVVVLDDGESACILLNGSVNDTLYLTDVSYSDTFKEGFTERNEIVSSQIMYVSLGLDPEKVETIQSLGMEIVPRTICYDGHNDTRYAQAVVAGYERYGITPPYTLAARTARTVYPDGDEVALPSLRTHSLPIRLIQTPFHSPTTPPPPPSSGCARRLRAMSAAS